ncbi:MAG: 6-carboxytetrahydropterin synthase [Chitinophagaceae bacterium]|nr:6-carboxytetrahydropterin synthase [Chitinophagaceae bacterium]
MNKVSVYRKEHFNAAHRLYNTDWDVEANKKIFGKCANENYHGHNYELIIKVTGAIDQKTGFVIDVKELSDLANEFVIKKFDHKNLNLDTQEFKNLNPTAENIAVVIYNLLRPHIKAELELRITLFETDRNYVKYPA